MIRTLALALSLLVFACADAAPTPAGGAGTSGAGGVSAGGAGGASTSGGAAGSNAGSAGVGGSDALSGAGGGGGVASGGAGGGAGSGGAAGSASAGASSGGSTATYDPCPPAPEACKVMPSGDSITVGAQSTDTGGYRVPLFSLALQNQKNLTFVGPSGAGPETVDGVPFPDSHDGHSGYIIDTVETRKGLLPLMQQNLTQHQPHIVLLMIGTNDVNSDVDLPNAPARLEELIDLVTTTAPDTLLVVAELVPTRTDELNVAVQAFNAAIPAMVEQRAQAGKHIQLVDMYSAFTANASYKDELLFDGLHPNDAGYEVMAETWYAAISPFL